MSYRIIPFVGGEWHGEARRYTGDLAAKLEMLDPPQYLGDNYYEANVVTTSYYYLMWHDKVPYYVHEDERDSFPENRDKPFETPNARRIRTEKELATRKRLMDRANEAKNQLIETVFRRHEYLDELVNRKDLLFGTDLHNAISSNYLVEKYIKEERNHWIAYTTYLSTHNKYTGVAPILKDAFKV